MGIWPEPLQNFDGNFKKKEKYTWTKVELEYKIRHSYVNLLTFKSLSASPTKWSKTLTQLVGNSQRIV